MAKTYQSYPNVRVPTPKPTGLRGCAGVATLCGGTKVHSALSAAVGGSVVQRRLGRLESFAEGRVVLPPVLAFGAE